jgi:hypothetical protein
LNLKYTVFGGDKKKIVSDSKPADISGQLPDNNALMRATWASLYYRGILYFK